MNKTKVIYIIIAVIAFIAGSYIGSIAWDLELENTRLHKELIGQKEQYRQISKNLAEMSIAYLDQKELYQKSQNEFKEYVKSSDERIKMLSDATYLIGQYVSKQNGPDYYFQTPKATRNFIVNEIKLQGEDSPAVGYILIKNDGRTYKKNYGFEINVKNLQTIDEDTGKVRVVSKAFLIQKSESVLATRQEGYKSWYKKSYPLEITGGTVLVDPTIKNQLEPKFYPWAPQFNLNIAFPGESPAVGLGLSTMGYGKTKNDLDFKFLQFGVHYNKESGYTSTIIPISWRPFDTLISNTYIGPGISYKNSQINYFLGIQMGL